MSLDADQLRDLWDHGALLLDNFCFCAANRVFKRLLKQSRVSMTARAHLWANVGIVHTHLGENHLAYHALANAAKLEPSCPIIWYCLGCVSYELEDYLQAKRFFEACERTFGPGIESIGHSGFSFHGDADRFEEYRFVLNRAQLRWNAQQCFSGHQHKSTAESLPHGRRCGINRIPGGYIFRAEFDPSPI